MSRSSPALGVTSSRPFPAAATLAHARVSVKNRAVGIHLLFFWIAGSFSEWTPYVEGSAGPALDTNSYCLGTVGSVSCSSSALSPAPTTWGCASTRTDAPWMLAKTARPDVEMALGEGPLRWNHLWCRTWGNHAGMGIHTGSNVGKERTQNALCSP